MSVRNMSVCSSCIWLQSIEQPQALLLASITRTVILLFKVIDMCTPWSLETRPRSKILAKTLPVFR
jgi:hypothetical protein